MFFAKQHGVGILAAMALSGAAIADETGQEEYMSSCASCHGEAADGTGPLADLMTVDVPPLTNLSAQNDGDFPMLAVIQTIDGRQGIKGHGYPMPVWGKRFQADTEEAGPYGREVLVRGRILSLALYLESIQQ